MIFFSSSLKTTNNGISTHEFFDNSIKTMNQNNELNSLGYIILSKDRQFLYAICEKDGCEGVGKYKILNSKLTLLNFIKTSSIGLCHLTLSPDEKFIYTASYNDGSMSVLDENEEIQHFEYEKNSLIHMVSFRPDTNELFSVDLGHNLIRVYNQDKKTGKLSPKEEISTNGGNGPRHLIFLNKNVFYVVYELSNQISVYINKNNRWECVQTISTLIKNCDIKSFASAIKINDNNLYVSNRGYNSIAIFNINSDYTLTLEGIPTLLYDFPRDFYIIDDNHIIIAFQKSNKLVLYKINNTLDEVSSINNLEGVIGLC